MSFSTHVLNAVTGRPAVGVPVQLEWCTDDVWMPMLAGETDDDGRIGSDWAGELSAGDYRVVFDSSAVFPDGFYPEVSIAFTVTDAAAHYHVPLLLSPFAYSTYRGS